MKARIKATFQIITNSADQYSTNAAFLSRKATQMFAANKNVKNLEMKNILTQGQQG